MGNQVLEPAVKQLEYGRAQPDELDEYPRGIDFSTEQPISLVAVEASPPPLDPVEISSVPLSQFDRFGLRYGLSGQERAILKFILAGMEPKAVGDEVGCAYASVRTHLRRMYRKLGCSGTRQVLLRYFCEQT